MKFCVFCDNEGRVLASVLSESVPVGMTDTGLEERPEVPVKDGFESVMYWNGGKIEWRFEASEPMPEPEPQPTPAPSKAEQESRRASAYRERVDPITCEIQRLRDMGGTPEEIAEAEQKRAAEVARIVEEFPYPASAGSADKTAQEVAK